MYGKVRQSSMSHFWRDVVEDPELYQVADESKWPTRKSKDDVVLEDPPLAPPRSNSQPPSKSSTRAASPSTSASRPSSPSPASSQVNRTESVVDVDECAMDVDYEKKAEPSVSASRCERWGGSSPKEDAPAPAKARLEIDPSDMELFCLGRTMGTQDLLGQRVLQVANIIRNLSFQEENQALLASNQTLVRFVVLCLGSRWDSLRQTGLDTLGNIALELSLERLSSDPLLQMVLGAVTARIGGPDRAGIIGALEVLNRIGQREDSEEVLQRVLDQEVSPPTDSLAAMHTYPRG